MNIKRQGCEYDIFLNGEFIFHGTEPEVQERFGLARGTRISTYCNSGAKISKIYEVVQTKGKRVYEAYEGDELVAAGSAGDIIRQLKLPSNYPISNFAETEYKMLGRYTVMLAGSQRIYPKTRHEKNLEYLISHLSRYGNTVFDKEPIEFMDELEKAGYKCAYRKVDSFNGKHRSKFYVLETV